MPKNRKLQNIIGTEHITDAAEAAIAAQASGGATVAFKNVAVSGQDNVVADAATDTLTLAGAGGTTITTNAATDTVTITSTQLSTEAVQDIVGAMFTGNTETNITATYEDSDGTIDLVTSAGGSPGGSDTHMQYNNGGSFGGISSFTYDDTADSEKFVISAESDQDLVRITQTGTGKALVVEDSTNVDSTPFEVNADGKVGINAAAGTEGSHLYVGGRIHTSEQFRAGTGTDMLPIYSFISDTATGIRGGNDGTVRLITSGNERFRVAGAGQFGIAGANYGTAGQVLTSGGASAAPSWAAAGGAEFAPTAQVWRSSTNVRNNITGLSPYTQGDDTSSNQPTSLERVWFVPFIAPETVAITKLSVYVSSANGSSPNVLFGIYTATEHTATNVLQRIPNALQMSTSIATATSGYNDGTVSAASGGSTTITQGTLYYLAWAAVASAAGYSTLQAWNGRHAPLGVSTGNAIQSIIQYTPYSYGDGLAASYPTTYQAAATITGAAVPNVFYRVD